jgi:hypothetical protein
MKTLTVVVLLGFAATASAQVVVHQRGETVAKEQQLHVLMEKTGAAGVHVSVETKPVIGAPYSAEAVSESVQVLADGNRIVRRSASRVYRDGKGRTRREELGPEGQVLTIAISDPASGTSFLFDPAVNIARRNRVAMFTAQATASPGTKPQADLKAAQEAELKAKQHAEQAAAQHAEAKVQFTTQHATVSSVGPITWVAEGSAGSASPATKEDLGQQVIEGVTVKGTRTTTVIPAGAIGNELPITVASEEWLSPELKVLVMTKHADPRSGETTYRLTGITRGEPDASLFDLPAGVTIK